MNIADLPFVEMNPNLSFLENIFRFDYQKIEELPDIELSKYCVALAQYNIYLKYQTNLTKSEIISKKRFIDSVVFELLTDDIIKKHKTKTDAKEYIITINPDLNNRRSDLDSLEKELILIDGIDRSITELINALKRELSRRENELQATRMERR